MEVERHVPQRPHPRKALRDMGEREDRRGRLRLDQFATSADPPERAKRRPQKILANFSTLLLSKVNGSPITASPSSPTLVSPMRPIFKVEPGAAALPPRISAMICVAE